MPSMFYTGLSCVRFVWNVGGGTINDGDPKSLVDSFDGLYGCWSSLGRGG